jgi:hypothetical protein
MAAAEALIAGLSQVCAGLPDKRNGPVRDSDYTTYIL